jgi:UDPglucose--hexose-1-phosphate uridylyltransferase
LPPIQVRHANLLAVTELRNDLVTGRLVLLAPRRSARPHTVPAVPTASAPVDCPFCPNHEHETPPEVARRGAGDPDTPGWRVRVVPNLYPIVGGPHAEPGATGAHEVAIMSPDHARDLGALDDGEVTELFDVLRDRARVHADAGLAHVQVLVNQGRGAGASIAHPHAQILAIDFVPPAVIDGVHRFEAARTDVVASDAAASVPQGGHVTSEPALTWCPWAAASPFETRITTPDAGPRFEAAPDDSLAAVAIATRQVVAAAQAILGAIAYNVVVHNGPAHGDQPFHWYVTVAPRIAIVAGFELGTGVFVNTVTPADAADLLKDALTSA